jgi:hypothetical protein
MRKRYLLVIIVLILIVSIFSITYYLSLPTTFPNAFNEPQNQGNETSTSILPFRFPWEAVQTTTNKSSGGGGGGGGQQGGGGGEATTNQSNITIPKIKYTLNIDSGFGAIDIITLYYFNGILINLIKTTPYSIDIDADTTACVAEVSNYTGYYWTLDNIPYSMSSCSNYSNGAIVTMDKIHNITLWQNS